MRPERAASRKKHPHAASTVSKIRWSMDDITTANSEWRRWSEPRWALAHFARRASRFGVTQLRHGYQGRSVTKIWGRDEGKNTNGPPLVAQCQPAREKLLRVPPWLFYVRNLKNRLFFARALVKKVVIFTPRQKCAARRENFYNFYPPMASQTPKKEQKFHPPSSWGGGGLVPQVPPPRDAPGYFVSKVFASLAVTERTKAVKIFRDVEKTRDHISSAYGSLTVYKNETSKTLFKQDWSTCTKTLWILKEWRTS